MMNIKENCNDVLWTAEESYLLQLNEMIEKNDDCRYCGVIPANESVEALKDYYVAFSNTLEA